jgi:hypothetical protein
MTKAPDDEPSQTEARPENGSTQQPTVSPSRLALTFLTEHFAVISAVAIILGILYSLVFLIAYLFMFNWQLIWLFE